jgi:hypothetical protein
LARFEFEFGIVSFCFSFIFVSLGESCLLVSWCAGGKCGMTCSDEDRGRSRRPGAEDRERSHRSGTWWPGGREVGWRHVRSAPGTWRLGARVSWLSLKTKVNGLAPKSVATVSSGLASKSAVTIFSSLASKLVVSFLVEPQNQGGGGFLVWASKPTSLVW